MELVYQVKQMLQPPAWKEFYLGSDADNAYNWAINLAAMRPNRAVKITERECDRGFFVGEIELMVNQPAWSGSNRLPPRDFETCIRSVTGDIDPRRSEILRLQEKGRSKRNEILESIFHRPKAPQNGAESGHDAGYTA
jgi:hypothetical protein